METCKEAILYFGRIQQMYNFFSSSPQRWEILKKVVKFSLHSISTTRWSARIEAVKPLANHLSSIKAAVEEAELLNLQPHVRSELHSIKQYLVTFECVLLSTLWLEILNLLQQTNLVIEARNATLDVEVKNLDNLILQLRKYREDWDKVLLKAKGIAERFEIPGEFQTTRNRKTQSDSEEHYRINVFLCIIDSVISGLSRRFKSLHEICNLFKITWIFESLSEEEIKDSANRLLEKYSKEISIEIIEEFIFLKNIYRTNFDIDPLPENLLKNIFTASLMQVFPNISIILRIFLSLPVSVASAERSFSTLKRIKNFNRSTMSQERLNGLSILNINCDYARGVDFSEIIKKFANSKARKAFLK